MELRNRSPVTTERKREERVSLASFRLEQAEVKRVEKESKPSSTLRKQDTVIGQIVVMRKRSEQKGEDSHRNGADGRNPGERREKPSLKPQTGHTVIDEIFAMRKRTKLEKQQQQQQKKSENGKDDKTSKPELATEANMKRKKKKKSVEDEEGRFTDRPARARKKTNGGLKIYTEEELGINNPEAGNTPNCPFDCDCCF